MRLTIAWHYLSRQRMLDSTLSAIGIVPLASVIVHVPLRLWSDGMRAPILSHGAGKRATDLERAGGRSTGDGELHHQRLHEHGGHSAKAAHK
jgi:hypothetical protein